MERAELPPAHWRDWLTALFPTYVSGGFAQRHEELWEWVWSIERDAAPRPFVAVWPREGGKSTSAELATVALGARGVRTYAWYVRETQDQADRSVTNIMDMLESAQIERFYPGLGERDLGKFGRPRAWRRQQLRTRSGFVVDAIGLDTAVRGAKVKERRPDFMVLDDIDGKHDTPKKTRKKVETLTASLLPAGSRNLAVLAIQNLIIPSGVFAQLADGSADFLANRIVSGPHPAVANAEVEQRDGRFVLTGGEPTWAGQGLAACQQNIDTWGYTAWLQEAQHEVESILGGVWDHVEFRRCAWEDVPELVRGAVWIDPAVTETDESDSMGVQADALGVDGIFYRFFSWEQVTSPEDVLRRGIFKCLELGFDSVGVETDQGGDVWRPAYNHVWDGIVDDVFKVADGDKSVVAPPSLLELAREALAQGIGEDEVHKLLDARRPTFRQAKAGAGHGSKVARNQRMLVDYERGKVVHVLGTHRILERALKRFPNKPLDLADAAFWGWEDLCGKRFSFG